MFSFDLHWEVIFYLLALGITGSANPRIYFELLYNFAWLSREGTKEGEPSTKKKKVMHPKHFFTFINSHYIKLPLLKCIVNGLFLPTVEDGQIITRSH